MKDSGLLKVATTDSALGIGTDTVKMSISEEGSRYLIANLTNLYTHPETAILREYTANALDSHVRAGQTRPIEVTIKENFVGATNTAGLTQHQQNSLQRSINLTVQDFGVGMSKTDIKEIYAQYGASTKRDSNTQVGAFGLGAKSALSLTNEFSLITVKDGFKTVCRVVKGEDGVGIIDFISETPTTEHSGVTVSLTILRTNVSLINESRSFFATWTPGSILINDEAPYSVHTDKEFLKVSYNKDDILGWVRIHTDRFSIAESKVSNKISLGGILYDLPKMTDWTDVANGNMAYILMESYINAAIGTIDLTPPREGIRYSQRTIATLRSTFQDFVDLAKSTVQGYFNNLSRIDALTFQVLNQNLINNLFGARRVPGGQNEDFVLDWNDEDISAGFNLNNPLTAGANSYGDKVYYELVKPMASGLEREEVKTKVSALGLLRFDKIKLKPYAKRPVGYNHYIIVQIDYKDLNETWFTRNLRDYAKSILNGETNLRVIATNNDVVSDVWLDALAPTVTTDTIIEQAKLFREGVVKAPRAPRTVEYPVWDSTEQVIQMRGNDEILGDRVFYFDRKDRSEVSSRTFLDINAELRHTVIGAPPQSKRSFSKINYPALYDVLETYFPEVEEIVFLESKSPNMLKKLVPAAESFNSALEATFQSMSVTEQEYLGMYSHLLEDNPKDVEFLKINCEHLMAQGVELIKDPTTKALVKYFGSLTVSKHRLNTLIAKNKINSVIDYSKSPDLKHLAPMLVGSIFNYPHMITYLNSIDIKEVHKGTISHR